MAAQGAKSYAEHIATLSRGSPNDPLYTGDHLKDLADYLLRPYKFGSGPRQHTPFAHGGVAYLYRLDFSPHAFPAAQRFDTTEQFGKETTSPQNVEVNDVLFLNGYVTPAWLNVLGASCSLDEHFLLEHLSFMPSVRRDAFAAPFIPTTSRDIIRITVPTVGFFEPRKPLLVGKELQRARRECLQKQRQRLRFRDDRAAGTSIVRRIHLHDAQCFSFEQDITIAVVQRHDGIGRRVLIWTDSADFNEQRDLIINEISGLEKTDLIMVPVVQESRRHISSWPADHGVHSFTQPLSHTLSALPANYGRMLRPDVANVVPMYAISELLDFMASAEQQFLNMMQQSLARQFEAAGESDDTAPTFADFAHTRDILEQHCQRLEDLLVTLQSDHSSFQQPSKTASSDLIAVAEAARRELRAKLQYLIRRLKSMIQRADRGSDLVLTHSNLQIAKRSWLDNRNIGELNQLGTWIAILYVPMSFLTSFFGMNFDQLGSGKLSLVLFAEVAVPLFVVLLMALLLKGRLQHLLRAARERHSRAERHSRGRTDSSVLHG